MPEQPRTEQRFAPGDPRATASRAWANASRVNAYWRTRPGPFQKVVAAILAIALIGVLVIGAVGAMVLGLFVVLIIWSIGMIQRGLDRLRGVTRSGRDGAGGDGRLRKNVRVMSPRE